MIYIKELKDVRVEDTIPGHVYLSGNQHILRIENGEFDEDKIHPSENLIPFIILTNYDGGPTRVPKLLVMARNINLKHVGEAYISLTNRF